MESRQTSNENVENEKENDGRWNRGVGNQGSRQTDNETFKNEEEDEEGRRKDMGKKEKERRNLYNKTVQNEVDDEEGRSKLMGKQNSSIPCRSGDIVAGEKGDWLSLRRDESSAPWTTLRSW
ncbi:hypothetical protein OUZ56_032776 [Daphnia magna]|uniref:Uncharacterized protein n=1 Tax=Daphnia magna TaxID=35525 RepID=A0ABQ9ZX25_9CRUS|nr:hypothetical protein OUZ56_032776 [Daphnia magna]